MVDTLARTGPRNTEVGRGGGLPRPGLVTVVTACPQKQNAISFWPLPQPSPGNVPDENGTMRVKVNARPRWRGAGGKGTDGCTGWRGIETWRLGHAGSRRRNRSGTQSRGREGRRKSPRREGKGKRHGTQGRGPRDREQTREKQRPRLFCNFYGSGTLQDMQNVTNITPQEFETEPTFPSPPM